VELFLHCIPCCCCSTSRHSRISSRRGAQGSRRSRRRGWSCKFSGDYPSSPPRRWQSFLTHSNSEQRPLFCRGGCFSVGDNIWRRDAPRRLKNAHWIEDSLGSSSLTKDRWWLFRTPPIHQGGGTIVRHTISGVGQFDMWGLSTANEFLSNSFWCTLSRRGGWFEDRHEATLLSLALS
jgi:hypothetical protein